MPNKKISELVELTTPADGDMLVINDVSEALDINKTKRISFLNTITSRIPKSLVTAIGDLIYATGSATLSVLAKPAADAVLKMTSAGTPSWKALTDFVLVYRRQGGNSTQWSFSGTTNYTPIAPRIQTGSVIFNTAPTVGSIYRYAQKTITLPVAYTGIPIAFASISPTTSLPGNHAYNIVVTGMFSNQFTIMLLSSVTDWVANPFEVYWMTIGE